MTIAIDNHARSNQVDTTVSSKRCEEVRGASSRKYEPFAL